MDMEREVASYDRQKTTLSLRNDHNICFTCGNPKNKSNNTKCKYSAIWCDHKINKLLKIILLKNENSAEFRKSINLLGKLRRDYGNRFSETLKEILERAKAQKKGGKKSRKRKIQLNDVFPEENDEKDEEGPKIARPSKRRRRMGRERVDDTDDSS